MFVARHRLWSSMIAYSAIAGLLLAAMIPCTAATIGCGSAQASMACCQPGTGGSDDCCSNGSSNESQKGTGDASHASCIPAACDCRPTDSSAPDSKTDQRVSAHSSDLGLYVSFEWTKPLFSATQSPFKANETGARLRRPLYLLTTHLLT